MSYLIEITNKNTGEVVTSLPTVSGNCFIIYGDGKTHDNLMHLTLNERTTMDNDIYRNLARKLVAMYPDELKHIPVDKIIFTRNETWEPSEAVTINSKVPIDIVKVSGMMHDLTGWMFEVKLRLYYLEQWTDAQRNAAILSQLLRIHQDGYIIKPGEHFTSKVVATFGFGYLEENKFIADVLEEKVSLHHFVASPNRQMTVDEAVMNAESDGETNEC